MGRQDRGTESRTSDWRTQAACRPLDSELFFPDRAAYRNNEVARAKAVCRQCPVRERCLRAALDGHEKAGIGGGLTPEERARLLRRNRRARSAEVATAMRPSVAESVITVRSGVTDTGYPTREQIRRGVAAGWTAARHQRRI